MSKCQTVQDEFKINELVVKKKEQGRLVTRKALTARGPASSGAK